MKSREITRVYEVEAESKKEAIRLLDEYPDSYYGDHAARGKYKQIEFQASKWHIVHIDDGNGDVEEWTANYT